MFITYFIKHLMSKKIVQHNKHAKIELFNKRNKGFLNGAKAH